MKIRPAAGSVYAAALVLAVALFVAACGDKDKGNANNSNNSNAARNANAATPVATATPTPVAASEDNALRNKVEANLTKAGVTGVTVDVKDGVVTLKGEVASAKFQDAVKAANDAGPKKVNNQLSKK